MISRVLPKIISACFAVASAILLCVFAPFGTAQTSGSAGASFWTEEQSRHNFEVVAKLVVPGDPSLSLFLRMPLAPEAGGLADTHQGGRQFASEDDPDWQNMKAWVLGQKAGGSSAP